ncbi:ankyrin [Ascobolus immersus RN42]|uniref:Ankyrin n=1 Tax=Ascobolus immersus RN42 TaxID=1160509 RepID=A0A3N4IDN3_ASCIM|nr:ankyrin [Ascobolus immersus RN42]
MQNPPVASHDRKKGRVIPDADWELHRQTIELLVCKERWILKDVMDHMAKNCGFIASQQQYTRKLEAWGAVKNLSTAEWNAVSYKVQKRKRESDKDSEVMVNGKRFDTKKLKTKANYARNRSDRLKSSQDTREHSYYYYKDQEASSMNTRSPQSADAISPKTPQNVSVYTPGNKIQIDLEKIPWFQFEKKLDDLLAKNLSPTNMQQLVSMLSRNENAQGGVERNTSTAGSGQILLYNSTLDHSAIPDAYTCLEALHLQRRKGEFWKALQTASESEDHNLVFRLKHALQLSSNKALSQHDMNSLLKTFKDAGEIDMIKAVCSLDDLGARSFAESVLDSSVRLGYYELTIYLLLVSRAVSPDLPCPRYGSLFCTAIRLGEGWNSEGEDDPHGHRRLLEGFLDAGVDIERGKPYTPLIMALLQCDNAVSVVSLLLDRKADVNRRTSPSERTPLQAILFEYNEDDAGGWEYRLDALELVKLLLDAGADVNALPAHGYRAHSCRPVYSYTALQLAATFLPLVELSSQSELGLEDEAGPRSTFADKENYEQIIDTLLSYSAHVNAPPGSFCGRTALQGAAEAASTSVVTKLLEYGADLNAPAALHGGFTALQAAAFHGNEELNCKGELH